MKFDFEYVLSSLPRVSDAAMINLRIAVLAFCLALVGGTLLTLIRSLKITPVNGLIALSLSFIRGTPILIQIFLIYYGLPAATGLRLPPEVAGVTAIALNSSFFISEIMRGSLPEIDGGQIEASTALGLPPRIIWRKVVLPQLFRRITPMLINEGTVVVKGTALLSVITVVEALRVSQQIGAAKFRPFEPILAAALMFLLINLALTAGGWFLERRFARESR
ncbi:amino acid ABC transporter permease (plasmid) [Salipiger sp. CCB-MM3]|uniref:amino acid ABC transporter permease n=1 Tax=Salipiger sp. CCB-MM3 TaxID=1792508 RepID=UPI00080AACEC|nr:amino acid ABC transporter permease [Salipiger sp. CCB-MM3]ANT63094.1 amino acid ABC transporter permease [Salipiger sp. CCB-MM3]